MSNVQAFAARRLVKAEGAQSTWTPELDVFSAYQTWCSNKGIEPELRKHLIAGLVGLGYVRARGCTRRINATVRQVNSFAREPLDPETPRDGEVDVQLFIKLHVRRVESPFKTHWTMASELYDLYRGWSRREPVGRARFTSALRRARYRVEKFGTWRVDGEYSRTAPAVV